MAYGGACAWCGHARDENLTLDHVNGDGAAHRKVTKDTYRWALEQGCPPDLQLLCLNCHNSKNNGQRDPRELARELEQEREAAREVSREAW